MLINKILTILEIFIVHYINSNTYIHFTQFDTFYCTTTTATTSTATHTHTHIYIYIYIYNTYNVYFILHEIESLQLSLLLSFYEDAGYDAIYQPVCGRLSFSCLIYLCQLSYNDLRNHTLVLFLKKISHLGRICILLRILKLIQKLG